MRRATRLVLGSKVFRTRKFSVHYIIVLLIGAASSARDGGRLHRKRHGSAHITKQEDVKEGEREDEGKDKRGRIEDVTKDDGKMTEPGRPQKLTEETRADE